MTIEKTDAVSVMKIIHTGDWHLGARLHEEDRTEEQRAFLDWLLELMRTERPDALVVTGDVFDVKAPSPQAQGLYYGFLAKAMREQLARKIVVTAGNHDNARLLAAPSGLLNELGVRVVAVADDTSPSDEVVVIEGREGEPGLAIAAVPFMYEAELANFGVAEVGEEAPRDEKVAAGWRRHCESVIKAAKARMPDAPVVVTGHCALRNAAFSDDESERCRRIGGVEAYDPAPLAAADYVALGHLHVPQSVNGYEKKMFYAGSPLRMSFDEKGEKGVNVVTLGAAGGEPEVRCVRVPETVPVVTVAGTPEAVKAEIGRYALEPGRKRFVRVQLKDFEGEARPHWTEIRALVKDTATRILAENDMRPAAPGTAALKAFAGRGIKQLQPREVAERKLRGSSEHYTEDQVAEYLKMFDEVKGEMA